MPKLTINTKSLYEPIEIEVDGVSYQIEKLDTNFFEKVQKFDAMIGEGKLDANALFVHECIGVPMKKAKAMDYRDINGIRNFIIKCLTAENEKNVGSGGKDVTK